MNTILTFLKFLVRVVVLNCREERSERTLNVLHLTNHRLVFVSLKNGQLLAGELEKRLEGLDWYLGSIGLDFCSWHVGVRLS